MSTPNACRRDEVVNCQPDRTVIVEKPTPPASKEQACISEDQFLRDHTFYSALSSWLFAIAGATNIGLLSAFFSKMVKSTEQDQPAMKPKIPLSKRVLSKYNLMATGWFLVGGLCMGVSNWLESKKVVTEWQLGAGKLQRKALAAETVADQSLNHAATDPSATTDTQSAQSKNWVASIQPKVDPIERLATRLGHG